MTIIEKKETLSVMMDSELPDDNTLAFLEELSEQSNPALMDTWRRFHLIRATLSRACYPLGNRIIDGVSAKLAENQEVH